MYDTGALDQPVQVTNMAGVGGGLAFGHFVNKRNADADLIVVASYSTSTRLAQNACAGLTADLVLFVGAIGADPCSVAFAGGSAIGGFDHLKPLMILQRADFTDITAVKYIGVDGGADAITQTVDGFIQPMSSDMSEVVGFLKAGEVRALAVLTEERVPGFEDIPTAKEPGLDVVAVNWRGLYIPRGVADYTFEMWAGRLQQVADSPEWAESKAASGLLSG